MFIFGHIGITLGILLILKKHPIFSKVPLNFPFIVFGAMLPDLIDKPLGEGIFADTFSYGRIYAHTLLFCILLFIMILYYLNKKKDYRVLIIPVASFLHLIEDRMWETPQTLFWPLMGWGFPKGDKSPDLLDYFIKILMNTYSFEPNYAFLSEIIGLSILLIAGLTYLKKK